MFLAAFLFIWESPMLWIFVIAIAILLFGSSRLPQLAKSIGQSRKAFKEGMREAEEDDEANPPASLTASTPSPQITQISDEELMAEMRKRVETKQN